MRKFIVLAWAFGLILGVAPVAKAAPSEVAAVGSVAPVVLSLVASLPSGQPVGTTVTWSTTATGPSGLEYRFSVEENGAPFRVVLDYSPQSTFHWTEIQEGYYQVQVAVKQYGSTAAPAILTSPQFWMTSRVVNGQPVVTATSNPLVALYSGVACTSGMVWIVFAPATNPNNQTSTPFQPCDGRSINVYLGGMRASSQYLMRQVVKDGTSIAKGPLVTFLTGSLTGVNLPTYSEPIPANGASSTQEGVVLLSQMELPLTNTSLVKYAATDLLGRVIWYYGPENYPGMVNPTKIVFRAVPGGTFLVALGGSLPSQREVLREIDLAGNVVRETSKGRINEQLLALGELPIEQINHDALRLPNGHTVFIGWTEKILDSVQGATGPVDIMGDSIVDLDQNFQVSWVWDAFNYMDINRKATLGETCNVQPPPSSAHEVCPWIKLAPVANDWLHANALAYSPADHNLLISFRHQDWIIKVDYRDGIGTGDIIWKLGKDGDFNLVDPSNNQYPWFSHQHGVENDVGSMGDVLLTLDDGNVRCTGQPVGCDSRGQVYQLDETNRVATLTLNSDLGGFSWGYGWAQLLSNGNYTFTNGFLGSGTFAQSIEELPNGAINSVLQAPAAFYRAYRLTSLYAGYP